MPTARVKPQWYRRLAVQIVLFLTIALLPIGLVSVIQTKRGDNESETNNILRLVSLTRQVGSPGKQLVERALGASAALDAFVPLLAVNESVCEIYLSELVKDANLYSKAALAQTSGETVCSAYADQTVDEPPTYVFGQINPAFPSIRLEPSNQPDRDPMITIYYPTEQSPEQANFIVMGLPLKALSFDTATIPDRGLIAATYLNVSGEVLTRSEDIDAAIDQMPPGVTPVSLLESDDNVLAAMDSHGDGRVYTIFPLINRTLYVLAVWDERAISADPRHSLITPALYTVLVWFASLLVAILALQRLVVRHVTSLGMQMRQFARNRNLPKDADFSGISAEIYEIHNEFKTMAHGILVDEAQLEDSIRSKNVLLKEVHHRVKNNLQLIASIMSIQIRNTKNAETKAVVQRLQDRVLSLATIHRDLYQTQALGRVDAGQLVTEIFENSIAQYGAAEFSIKHTQDIDKVLLFPDQAVPLSLLVSEALSNATKYLAPAENGDAWIDVSFKSLANGNCRLKIANSTEHATKMHSVGLGSMLINAFIVQLAGKIEIEELPDRYSMTVEFRATEFAPESADF